MSRGGFRGGGRGGGRGGFGRGNQMTMDLDGLDVSFHDIPLFPVSLDLEMKLPPVFKALLPEERELLDFDKKFLLAFKDSPYYLEDPPVRDDLKYFPDELAQVKDPAKKITAKTAKGGLDLDKRLKELEKEESGQAKRVKTDGAVDEDDLEPETNEYDEEEQEEEDDYQIDHYDDDHDGVGGDDSDHGGGDY
ncbi:hypothetical protein HDU98_010556 [Podochytrium sp. JEL0797]|nr:hypothetical protein HDU98_010556 [Podochytrium sp. JEL0797]